MRYRQCLPIRVTHMALLHVALACVLAAEGVLRAQPVPEQPGIPKGTFPIVAFSAGNPSDSNFAEVKRLGFDYVHRYRLASHPDAAYVKGYLDTAARNKLKVMMDVSGFVDPRHSPAKEMSAEERLQVLRAGVRKWRDHSALGFWYVYDEPSPKAMSPAQLREIHDAVKAESPDIPTAIAQHWGEKWWEYVPCVDLVMPDFYPVREQLFPHGSKLQQMTEFFGKVGRVSEHTIPIVQCFGFPRLPNATEVRYMLFSSLTHGIDGMAFWSYWYARYKPFQIAGKDGSRTPGKFDPQYMKTVYSPVLLELKSFVTAVMPAAEVDYVHGAKDCIVPDADVLHGLWRRDGTPHVVVVSNLADERDVDIAFDCGLRNSVLEPVGSTRNTRAEIRDHRLIVGGMKPWEVFVWRCLPPQ